MIKRTKKKAIVKDLVKKIKKSQAIYFTDFSGVSVSDVTTLRSQLKAKEGLAKVAKKNLVDIAFSQSGYNFDLRNKFPGSLMLNFVFADLIDIAKIIWQFSKKNKTFKILGGVIDGKFIPEKEVSQLAQIPSKDILLGRLVGSIASPLQRLAYVLNGNIQKLAIVVERIKETK